MNTQWVVFLALQIFLLIALIIAIKRNKKTLSRFYLTFFGLLTMSVFYWFWYFGIKKYSSEIFFHRRAVVIGVVTMTTLLLAILVVIEWFIGMFKTKSQLTK